MDSRRLFLSKRETSQRQDSSSKPENVLSLVKRIFSWGKHSDVQNPQPVSDGPSTRRSFIEQTPKRQRTTDAPPNQTPSQILSSFFQGKGDDPLTDIEYEGVQALLAKARTNDTIADESVLESRSKKRRTLTQIPDILNRSFLGNLTGNGSFFYSTPQKQTLLLNPNASQIITPDYRPTYHRVNPRNVQSVKRVYHFSGVPSPYRTRISAPTRSTRSKSALPVEKSQPSIVLPTDKSISKSLPMSATAGTLLSIIDGAETKTTKLPTETKAAKFSNPYSSAGSIKAKKHEPVAAHMPSKKTFSLSAKDITDTAAFDKSDPMVERNTNGGTGAVTLSSSTNVPKSAIASFRAGNEPTRNEPSTSQKSEIGLDSSTFPASSSLRMTKRDHSRNCNEAEVKIPFSLNGPTKSQVESENSKSVEEEFGSNHRSKASSDFSFPSIELKVVNIDSAAVERLKPGYKF